jgi:hypothetical protein
LREWGSHKILFEVNIISLSISEVIGTNHWVQNKAAILALDSFKPQEPQSAHPDLPRKCTCYKAQVIFVPRDPAFIQNQNPVYCGLESLRCAINMERASVLYANATYSFVYVAHLYNAAKQLELLKGYWDGLGRAINVHIGTLFNGELPSTGLQMFRRFLIRMKFLGSSQLQHSLGTPEVKGRSLMQDSLNLSIYLNSQKSSGLVGSISTVRTRQKDFCAISLICVNCATKRD